MFVISNTSPLMNLSVLDAMMNKAGFWVGNELYERVLKEAGEK